MVAFEKFNEIGTTAYGKVIYNKNDVYIGRSIELYGEYAEREAAVFDQILKPGQIVVEVGANIGVHTLFFAHRVGPEGCVLAFEPQRIVYQTLCGNMAVNSITNVHCWNMAMGANDGEITVPFVDYRVADNFGGVSLGGTDKGELVPVATLDSFQLPACDFIKIDVEGMEEDVLRGAAETIKRLKPILYVECDRPEKEASLLKLLASFGYRMHWHLPELYNADNFARNQENVFQNIVSRNLLCIDESVSQELTGFEVANIPEAA